MKNKTRKKRENSIKENEWSVMWCMHLHFNSPVDIIQNVWHIETELFLSTVNSKLFAFVLVFVHLVQCLISHLSLFVVCFGKHHFNVNMFSLKNNKDKWYNYVNCSQSRGLLFAICYLLFTIYYLLCEYLRLNIFHLVYLVSRWVDCFARCHCCALRWC